MAGMSTPSLAGRRVVVTRPRARAGELIDCLTSLGAVPLVMPAIETVPVAGLAATNLSQYDWIVFTSAAGVAALFDRQPEFTAESAEKSNGHTGRDASLTHLSDGPHAAQTVSAPPGDGSPSRLYLQGDAATSAAPQFAAVGPATAAALRERGLTIAFMPADYTAEALAAGLPLIPGQRVLLPLAEIASDDLAHTLRERGAVVDEVTAYTTRLAAPDPAALAELLHGVDAITFTSASTVRGFTNWQVPIGDAVVACLGPQTAQAAQAAGLPVHLIAPTHTAAALAGALAQYFAALA
jgi:uroporphyrinogen III methyltransferase/synthase